MKLANAIKKLTANGFEITASAHTLQAKKGNQVVGCAISRDGSANSFYTKDSDQHSDGQRDYFVETWHDNISQAIQFVDRYDKA
jgi:hypothetical protein